MPANDGLNIADCRVQVLVSSRTTGGRYTICQIETAGPDTTPSHAHAYEDGFFYVLEGELQFQIAGQTTNASAGTALFIPRRTAYRVSHEGPGTARLLAIAHPGGLDLFFQDLATAANTGLPFTPEKLAPILEKHGIRLVADLDQTGNL
jgi:quercetin dioxygenase-like cupin family protein